MIFKNITIYKFDAENCEPNDIAPFKAFVPCSSQESESSGWIPAYDDPQPWTLKQSHHALMSFRIEKRLLPSSVINKETEAKRLKIEEQQGFKPGRKQTREIKEDVILELLPKAFTSHVDVYVWLDFKESRLIINSTNQNQIDLILSALVKSGKINLMPLHVNVSPALAMTQWLAEYDTPNKFTIDQDTELKAFGNSRATVRYSYESIDTEEAQRHIKLGKQCTRLALTWDDKISFKLDDSLRIKSLSALDVIDYQPDANAQNDAELFNSEFALFAGELSKLINDLIAALGGEKTD